MTQNLNFLIRTNRLFIFTSADTAPLGKSTKKKTSPEKFIEAEK